MPQMEQQLVTFGAPRVGNPEFAKLANQQLYRPANDRTGGFLPNSIRVVNYNDLIPQLFTRLINYQHYGPEVWISTAMNDKAVLCYPHQDQENEHCSNSVYAETDPVLELKRHRVYLGVDMEQDRQCVAYSPNYRWLTKAAIYAFNKLYQYLQSKA
ncbi:hypothetical protein BDF19DRAFT_474606 [Syncephalis fuscata]|nr:hypothetical protein BDF19DRAFT_474606 [Syncephalis fuscata]